MEVVSGRRGRERKENRPLVDEILSPLPLEALNFLADAAAVSRDFSMHILLRRLTDASSRGDVSLSGVTYLVDLRNEDEGEDGAIPTAFAAMKERFGADWHGAQGSFGRRSRRSRGGQRVLARGAGT